MTAKFCPSIGTDDQWNKDENRYIKENKMTGYLAYQDNNAFYRNRRTVIVHLQPVTHPKITAKTGGTNQFKMLAITV